MFYPVVHIWTSTLQKIILTANPIVSFPNVVPSKCMRSILMCHGLWYEEIRKIILSMYAVTAATSMCHTSDTLSPEFHSRANPFLYEISHVGMGSL
jgi:hypothetical protein